jgi:hypothetical protein
MKDVRASRMLRFFNETRLCINFLLLLVYNVKPKSQEIITWLVPKSCGAYVT